MWLRGLEQRLKLRSGSRVGSGGGKSRVRADERRRTQANAAAFYMHIRGVADGLLPCGIHREQPPTRFSGDGSLGEPRPSQDGILDRGFTEGVAMQRLRIAFGVLVLLAVSSCTPYAASAQNLTCGLKPIPAVGCRVGRCVNGGWEQVCDSNPGLSCGLKPIPAIGCRVGRCVDGGWEQICDQSPGLSCGLKPIPAIGCRIARCVDGAWEQVCD